MFDVRGAWRSAIAVTFVTILVASAPGVVRAQEASPAPGPSAGPADCTLVTASDASAILGTPVEGPDEASERGGICFFTTRAVSQEGSLTYALVDAARLPQRRAFFLAAARRCGNVAKGAARELACRAYRNLAEVADIPAYFKARTDFPDSVSLPKLDVSAVAAPDAVYVLRGDVVYECVVRHGEVLDVERSSDLARLVLSRAPQP